MKLLLHDGRRHYDVLCTQSWQVLEIDPSHMTEHVKKSVILWLKRKPTQRASLHQRDAFVRLPQWRWLRVWRHAPGGLCENFRCHKLLTKKGKEGEKKSPALNEWDLTEEKEGELRKNPNGNKNCSVCAVHVERIKQRNIICIAFGRPPSYLIQCSLLSRWIRCKV